MLLWNFIESHWKPRQTQVYLPTAYISRIEHLSQLETIQLMQQDGDTHDRSKKTPVESHPDTACNHPQRSTDWKYPRLSLFLSQTEGSENAQPNKFLSQICWQLCFFKIANMNPNRQMTQKSDWPASPCRLLAVWQVSWDKNVLRQKMADAVCHNCHRKTESTRKRTQRIEQPLDAHTYIQRQTHCSHLAHRTEHLTVAHESTTCAIVKTLFQLMTACGGIKILMTKVEHTNETYQQGVVLLPVSDSYSHLP